MYTYNYVYIRLHTHVLLFMLSKSSKNRRVDASRGPDPLKPPWIRTWVVNSVDADPRSHTVADAALKSESADGCGLKIRDLHVCGGLACLYVFCVGYNITNRASGDLQPVNEGPGMSSARLSKRSLWIRAGQHWRRRLGWISRLVRRRVI